MGLLDEEATLSRMEQAAAQRAAPGRIQIKRAERRAAGRPPVPGRKWGLDDAFQYEIYDERHPDIVSGRRTQGADDPLVRQLKSRINAAGLTRRQMYEFVGEGAGMLFRDANSAYNLEYGLRERPTITLECLRRWLAVMGEELVVAFQTTDNGWFSNACALRDAVLEGETDLGWMQEQARYSLPHTDDCLQILPSPGGGEE